MVFLSLLINHFQCISSLDDFLDHGMWTDRCKDRCKDLRLRDRLGMSGQQETRNGKPGKGHRKPSNKEWEGGTWNRKPNDHEWGIWNKE